MGKSLTRSTFDTMETERNQNKTKTLWGKDGLLPKGLLANNSPEMSMMNILHLLEALWSGHRFPSQNIKRQCRKTTELTQGWPAMIKHLGREKGGKPFGPVKHEFREPDFQNRQATWDRLPLLKGLGQKVWGLFSRSFPFLPLCISADQFHGGEILPHLHTCAMSEQSQFQGYLGHIGFNTGTCVTLFSLCQTHNWAVSSITNASIPWTFQFSPKNPNI